MGVNYFTKEQQETLNKNQYVLKVSEKAITYTEEFREEFYRMYINGMSPSAILIELGFNPQTLGRRRIDNIVQGTKKMADRGCFRDTRADSSGRPKTKEMTAEEEIAYLKHKIEYQNQQIEALKKISFVEKKKIWRQQQKSIK